MSVFYCCTITNMNTHVVCRKCNQFVQSYVLLFFLDLWYIHSSFTSSSFIFLPLLSLLLFFSPSPPSPPSPLVSSFFTCYRPLDIQAGRTAARPLPRPAGFCCEGCRCKPCCCCWGWDWGCCCIKPRPVLDLTMLF